jgi:hypothetical protein
MAGSGPSPEEVEAACRAAWGGGGDAATAFKAELARQMLLGSEDVDHKARAGRWARGSGGRGTAAGQALGLAARPFLAPWTPRCRARRPCPRTLAAHDARQRRAPVPEPGAHRRVSGRPSLGGTSAPAALALAPIL